MHEHPISHTDTKSLDDLFMTAADGDAKSVHALCRSLAESKPHQYAVWAADVREAWRNGAEIVLDSLRPADLQPLNTQFLHHLLDVGYDSTRFRDLLAAAVRKEHANYPDPAGLIAALGIHHAAAVIAEVAKRFEVFTALRPKVFCHHPAHNLGTVVEVDGFANTVAVQFDKGRQQFPLELALTSLLLVKAGTRIEKLLRKEAAWEASTPVGIFRQEVAAAAAPHTLTVPDTILESIVVPRLLNAHEFALFLQGRSIPTVNKSTSSPAPAPKKDRPWYESRTLEELVDLLEDVEKVTIAESSLKTLRDLFERGARRPEQAVYFGNAVARLWAGGGNQAGLQQLFADFSACAVCWQDKEIFATVADKLPGKLPVPWFGVTLEVKGADWTAEGGMGLPLRLWASLGKAMERAGQDEDLLVDKVLRRINSATPSPDMLLWLWKSELPERTAMADGQLIFRTLAKPVKGSFCKAQKELRKLLADNEEFQRFLMHDGDSEYIASLVSCVRHIQLFDKGEQQSLLVKIVRLFPDARYLVEERPTTTVRVRPTGRITSLRSFEMRRRELEEIIQIKIPANSAAIGHARGYGDLRENAEFKAAKEQQRLLRLRRAELERGFHEVKSLDFSQVQVGEVVVPGCQVVLEYADSHLETHTIVGIWDGDPDKHFLSYESPLARSVLGAKAGDKVTVGDGDSITVKAIQAIPDDLRRWLRGEDLL